MQVNFALPDSITSGNTSNGTAWSRVGSGKTLVLMHGVGMNKSVWAPEVNLLSDSFDVLVYDMWGHGDSDLPTGELSLADYTIQLANLLSELGISEAFVAGHSMGGLIAIDFALNHSEMCLGMCAMNAVFNRTPAQSEAVKKRATDLAAGGVSVNLSETLERWFGQPGTHEYPEAENLAKQLLLVVNPAGYAKAYEVFANSDNVHADRLSALKVPALFFTADGDPNSTPEMSQAMAALAPLGISQVLTGHRHMMTLTAPLQISESLNTFFNSHSNSSNNQ
jgi:(E)-2-((N-methylformamido)methylene)succinate hydrolase